MKSVSSGFSKELSYEAKAKARDFKIVLEDPRGRRLVPEDSNTATETATATATATDTER